MGGFISALWSGAPAQPSLLGKYIEPAHLLTDFENPAESFLIRPLRRYYEEEEQRKGAAALKLVSAPGAITGPAEAPAKSSVGGRGRVATKAPQPVTRRRRGRRPAAALKKPK